MLGEVVIVSIGWYSHNNVMRKKFYAEPGCPSVEEIRKRDEQRQKENDEQKQREARWRAEIVQIQESLEASPAVHAVRQYLTMHPMPKWEALSSPEERPFPPVAILPEYKLEKVDEQPLEFTDGLVRSYWVCSSCGAKTIAKQDSITEEHDEEGSLIKIPSAIERPRPSGYLFGMDGGKMRRGKVQNGNNPPDDCCYNKAVDEYETACRAIEVENSAAQKQWEKTTRDEAHRRFMERLSSWYEAAPRSIQYLFDGSGQTKNSLAHWISTGEKDHFFHDYALPNLAELEKLNS
ncbi:MAG: hypothetical protein AAB759_02075 [Patescibacteria group bacterium]